MLPPALLAATSPSGHWVHDLSPFLVQFGDNIGIRYYGLAYVIGFLACGWLLRRYHRAGLTPLNAEASSDLVFFIVIGTLLGGRVGYFLLYQLGNITRDPLAFFRVWEGGMASHGAFVGVTLALWWFARQQRVSMLHLGDLVASAAPVGIFFGRLANFWNGELWGRITDVSWAVIFPASASANTPTHLILPRHPSQLYEAFAEGLVLFLFCQWRLWRTDAVARQPGRLAGEFLIGYALVRMVCEQFREPDASLLLGVSRGTFYSVFLIGAGLFLILRARRAATSAATR